MPKKSSTKTGHDPSPGNAVKRKKIVLSDEDLPDVERNKSKGDDHSHGNVVKKNTIVPSDEYLSVEAKGDDPSPGNLLKKNKIVDGVFDDDDLPDAESKGDTDADFSFSTGFSNDKPIIKISPKVMEELRNPWKNSLIVKLLGKNIEYDKFSSEARALWNLQRGFKSLDLGENYFLFTFESIEDLLHVYTNGPWVIMDHFLSVRKWEPYFKPSDARNIRRTAIWVRFHELPVEFLLDKVLYNLARSLGRPIKVDHGTQGTYARVCIEIDLSKPLCPVIEVEGKDFAVEYESLNSFCFDCSHSGHKKYVTCTEPELIEVPDPDFNQFDKDISEECVGKIWALYDSVDTMPRDYAQIKKIYSISEFKLKIKWLEADPDNEDENKWLDAGLPVSCRNFKKGDTMITDNRLLFSHRVNWEKGSKRDSYKIHPRKGETWALFKNWDMNWHSNPDPKRKYKFEFVEILSDYSEGIGVSVAYLGKVKGFTSVFCKTTIGGVDSFQIPPSQFFRFSHMVPSFPLSGDERDDVPINSFELDPACLTPKFEEVDISKDPNVDVETVVVSESDSPVKDLMELDSEGNSGSSEESPKAYENPGMEVPDPDFSDFDRDRSEGCFAVGQIWSLYDTLDGMPRCHAKIRRINSTSEFKLTITWLNPYPCDEEERKWFNAGLPVSCGNLKMGKTETFDHCVFSHQINLRKGRGHSCKLYPRKGETWALFKNWDINWHSNSDSKRKYEFEFVEILSNYREDTGVCVAYLGKVKRFTCVFSRTKNGGVDSFKIPRSQLFRFSHMVPSFRLSGGERDDVPRNSLELDPASLPPNLEVVGIPRDPKVHVENVEDKRESDFEEDSNSSDGTLLDSSD